MVESGIDKDQRWHALPGNQSPDHPRGLGITQAFADLHQRDEGQTSGPVGRAG